jgi:hypothetical protein
MGEAAGNLEIARRLAGPRKGRNGSRAKRVPAPDVVLEEFPNLLTPLGKKRDLAAALEGAERGHVPADV